MTPRRVLTTGPLALLVLLTLSACASSGSVPESGVRGDPDRLTRDQLAGEEDWDVYTVVSRLRPRWLRVRGDRTFISPTEVSLVIDGVPVANNPSRLREIRVAEVEELRYLDAPDATIQYGPDMAGGAILVFLRRG